MYVNSEYYNSVYKQGGLLNFVWSNLQQPAPGGQTSSWQAQSQAQKHSGQTAKPTSNAHNKNTNNSRRMG
jgi:hypothetical protein